jgi:dynein heavy chain
MCPPSSLFCRSSFLIKATISSLFPLHREQDNVKFLTTLERHFKNLSTGSLATVKETIPGMMNAIRKHFPWPSPTCVNAHSLVFLESGMVWIISRYYNREECMTALLERIAWEIANKISEVINVKKILRDPEGMKKIQEGKEALEKWKDVIVFFFFFFSYPFLQTQRETGVL